MSEAGNHVHRGVDPAFPQRRRVGVRIGRGRDVIVLPDHQSDDGFRRNVTGELQRVQQ